MKKLFKWFNYEYEYGFLYLSLYLFIIYFKNTEVHSISFSEKMSGFYFGKYFIKIIS